MSPKPEHASAAEIDQAKKDYLKAKGTAEYFNAAMKYHDLLEVRIAALADSPAQYAIPGSISPLEVEAIKEQIENEKAVLERDLQLLLHDINISGNWRNYINAINN